MAYSIEEVLTVVRTISKIIENNPMLLSEEGVFRVSGYETHVDQILTLITSKSGNNDRIPTLLNQGLSIHDFLGAFKKAIRERESTNDSIFNDTINELVKLEELGEKEQTEKPLDQLLLALIQSEDLNNIYLAEIYYTYFKLASNSSDYEEKNKMSARNLGIILGPGLIGIKGSANISVISTLNDITTKIIASNCYNNALSFNQYLMQYYPEPFLHTVNVRDNELEHKLKITTPINNFVISLTNLMRKEHEKAKVIKLKIKAIDNSLFNLEAEALGKAIKRKESKKTAKKLVNEKEKLTAELFKSGKILEDLERQNREVQQKHLNQLHSLHRLDSSIKHIKRAFPFPLPPDYDEEIAINQISIDQLVDEIDDTTNIWDQDFELTQEDEEFFHSLKGQKATFFAKSRNNNLENISVEKLPEEMEDEDVILDSNSAKKT